MNQENKMRNCYKIRYEYNICLTDKRGEYIVFARNEEKAIKEFYREVIHSSPYLVADNIKHIDIERYQI